MKYFGQFLVLVFILMSSSVFSQITLNACHNLIENQDFVFNDIGQDATGRTIFETNPVDGNQPCGGVGSCEFRIAWNTMNMRWEIFADDGNGAFASTYVLYYNIEASLPNPPSLMLGNWIEETAITNMLCGGIISLTGDVQDMSTLGITDESLNNEITVYPNPAKTVITIKYPNAFQASNIDFYDILGKLVIQLDNSQESIDVSQLNKGIYYLKVSTKNKVLIKKIIVD